ncbi:hypothetical protein K7H92_15390 [Pseudomonas stutzeri]|nr:hypothetical protein [Stutzerimonas stutzeri]
MTTNATAAPAGDSAVLKKAPDLVEVTLAKPHTHQRKPYDKGAKLKITPAQRATLIARGIVAGTQEA